MASQPYEVKKTTITSTILILFICDFHHTVIVKLKHIHTNDDKRIMTKNSLQHLLSLLQAGSHC